MLIPILGGGFRHFLFSPLFGEDFQFDEYFLDGLKPPTSFGFSTVLHSGKIIITSLLEEPLFHGWSTRAPQTLNKALFLGGGVPK